MKKRVRPLNSLSVTALIIIPFLSTTHGFSRLPMIHRNDAVTVTKQIPHLAQQRDSVSHRRTLYLRQSFTELNSDIGESHREPALTEDTEKSPRKEHEDRKNTLDQIEVSNTLPPMRVEDTNVLFYDVFLILNLVMASSFWVAHRMHFEYLGMAFSEGSLLCLLWIASGLYYGSFLDSAVDGHYGSADERGGPKAALLLGLQTYIGAINLRLVFALASAFVHHRPVGTSGGEELIALEIAFGFMLMPGWRALHSMFVPRFK